MARRKGKPESFQGPKPLERNRLERLPQSFDVWQVAARSVAATVQAGSGMAQHWMIVVVSITEGQILAFELTQEPPSANQIWQTLVKALAEPASGQPHRPTEVQVRPEERFVPLHTVLSDLGIDFTATHALDQIDEVFEQLAEQLPGRNQAGLLDMPGMTPEVVGSFFESAAGYFRQAPWKQTGERTIKVECAKFTSGPWYAVLMGQGGMTCGLVLYDNLELVDRIKQADLTEEENARLTSALVVVFGTKEDLTEADLEAAQRYGWKVAGRKAYPSVYRKEPGLSMRPPLVWELELLEGCLRAIPVFVNRDERTKEEKVPVAGGELKLVLSWEMEGVRKPEGNVGEERDYLLDVANEQLKNIRYAYKQFEDRKPIVLFDIQEQRLYVYPYEEFKSEMNSRNQAALTTQYEKALRENKIVVFIRDNDQRKLVSFSMDYE